MRNSTSRCACRVPKGGFKRAVSTGIVNCRASWSRKTASPRPEYSLSIAFTFSLQVSSASGSFSTKNTRLAPSKSAPMPRIPVPAPRSTLTLPSRWPNFAFQRASAAMEEGVRYCSCLTLGAGKPFSLLSATSSSFFDLMHPPEPGLYYICNAHFSCVKPCFQPFEGASEAHSFSKAPSF